MPENFASIGGKAGKGRKQTPEQIAKRVTARRATLATQGRTV
jgi:ribosomal protein S30